MELNKVRYFYTIAVEGSFTKASQRLGIVALSQGSALLKNKLLVPILPHLHSEERTLYFTYPKELKHIKVIKTLEKYLVNVYTSSNPC